ncbi:hypothetical protein A5634_20525 [Mycobacterium asiaticum]|uniref:LppP/LprE family lipoprotein n=1 Tax=Mycobacterium asiaticum TaxID=1790 RepID=A0A1A3P2R5_MYCAS|nr:LppP/LprE family lipoprotein [Mycobacterium asiaticum]OBK28466.1 hypothetical protein A5634_20525 [Mycobacterium asiaticum]
MAADYATDGVDPDWPPPAYDPSDDLDTTPPPGRSIWLVAALVVLVCIGAVALFVFSGNDQPRPAAKPTPSSTTGTAAPPVNAAGCGPDLQAALSAALGQVPPDRKTGKQWDRAPQAANYDPCADLSAVVLTVQDATPSSPDVALMFHRGAFVGTATPNAYPFTELEGPASTNDIVVLTYRTRQSCSTCFDGTLTTVGFQWKDDKVQMLDWPPESPDAPR